MEKKWFHQANIRYIKKYYNHVVYIKNITNTGNKGKKKMVHHANIRYIKKYYNHVVYIKNITNTVFIY